MKTKLNALAVIFLVTAAAFWMGLRAAQPDGVAGQAMLDRPPEFDSAHRFLFNAVLEGCYEDGLSTEDVTQILMKGEKEKNAHFVYACPVCTPTIHALEAYQSRPAQFSSLKSGSSTFGPGLSGDMRKKLYSAKIEERLSVVHDLVQTWVTRRMTMMRLTPTEKSALESALQEKRKKGMAQLKGTGATPKPSQFGAVTECAACNGAVGIKLEWPTMK